MSDRDVVLRVVLVVLAVTFLLWLVAWGAAVLVDRVT